jgi:hypothetical protein
MMAKRREDEEEVGNFSWYDQPLYETNDDDDDRRDPRFRDDDKKSSGGGSGGDRKPPNTGGKHVGLVGGCFIVILNAILSIILFLALGVGLVLAGRATGIISETAPSAPVESSEQSSQETGQAETVVEVQPTEVACDPAGWWSAQQGNFDYFVTTYDRVTLAAPAEPLETIVQQMQTRRNDALALPLDPCMADVQGIFTQGMDQMLAAVQAVAAGDRNGSVGPSDSADDALSNTLIALWDLGVSTAPDAPPALGIPRGGNCEATPLGVWANPFRQEWGRVYTLLVQIDVINAPGVARVTLDSAAGFQRNIEAMTPPECATRPQQLAVVALNSYTSAANTAMQGGNDGAREIASGFARAYVTMNAWLEWIGAGMV